MLYAFITLEMEFESGRECGWVLIYSSSTVELCKSWNMTLVYIRNSFMVHKSLKSMITFSII